ncbi:MAG TPA: HD domain-containing phosphohydrolase [Candidatus Polarisedimenticolaceae bacterium]|nr:HD domain-containing phosphohydrolase [Candidatus Polarisedimenticolaceae bacterium]
MSVTATQSAVRHSVLVVDDSNLLRGILKEELEAEGFEVHMAEDGPQALERARDLRPDVILLDVGLPGIDGYEVCRRVKGDAATADIPVLMITALNELKDKLAGFEAGADDYLTKPFFTKELLARLRKNLRMRESIHASRRLGQSYLEMLFGIGSAITSPFKVDDEVEIILRQGLVAVGAAKGAILLLDQDHGMLEVKGTMGMDAPSDPQIGQRHRISDKLPVVDAAESGTTGIRIYEDPSRSVVFVPMVSKEKLVGGIELYLGERRGRLAVNEQKVLYALASQAAIFLVNARLERDVRSMFLSIIVSMAGAVDAKDAYTHGHSLRVARVSLIVAQQKGLAREELEPLLLSAILHDVGKIGIPDNILKKPEKLNRQEFEIMKGHAVAGAKMLQHIRALENVIPGILYHHEYWNGTGYPHGLAGEGIPLQGRIIHIGDAFDAMTTDRVYRTKIGVAGAMNEITKHAGHQFDPDLVQCLVEAHRQGLVPDGLPESTPTLHELIDRIR